MKGLVSILALALALAFTGPAFAGAAAAKPKPIARRLAARGMLRPTRAQRRSRKATSRF